ncbi:hypothetical protein ABFS83_04G192600 [Erythranthe nasuta]
MEKEKENESNSSAIQLKGVPIHGGEFTQYNVLGNLFEVPSKYIPPIAPVGRGAYGLVWYSLSLSLSLILSGHLFIAAALDPASDELPDDRVN